MDFFYLVDYLTNSILLPFEALFKEISHRHLEFLEADYPISVHVCLLEERLPDCIVYFCPTVTIKHIAEVLQRYLAIFINIEYLESHPHVFGIGQHFAVDAGLHEFLKVDHAVPVEVAGLNNLVPIDLVP